MLIFNVEKNQETLLPARLTAKMAEAMMNICMVHMLLMKVRNVTDRIVGSLVLCFLCSSFLNWIACYNINS